MKLKFGIGLAIPLLLLSLSACSRKPAEPSSSSRAAKPSQSEKPKKVSEEFQKVVDAAGKNLDTAKETYGDTYSEITVKGEPPETLTFTYTYKEDHGIASFDEEEAMTKALVASIAGDFDRYGEDFWDFEERFLYLNPDGSEFCDITVTSLDIEEAKEKAEAKTKVSAGFQAFVDVIREGSVDPSDEANYSDIQVEAEPPETVRLTFTYASTVTGVTESTITNMFITNLGSYYDKTKILYPDFAVHLILKNPDGAVFYDHTITRTEVKASGVA